MPSPKHAFLFVELRPDAANLGGKARGLLQLGTIASVRVPPGFLVPFEGFRGFWEHAGVLADLSWLSTPACLGDPAVLRAVAARVQRAILQCELPSELRDAIHTCAHFLADEFRACGVSRFAVRSSAGMEDSAHSSAAGVFESHLNVQPNDVPGRVRRCCAAAFSSRVIEYALNRIIPAFSGFAVIVQAMVTDARASGTAFTCDLFSGGSGVTIEAGYGLGEGLVHGDMIPDQYLYSADGKFLNWAALGSKRVQTIPVEGGTQQVAVDAHSQQAFCLTRAQVDEIARTAQQVGAQFGRPVDMEWVHDSQQLWFLQVRPIASTIATGPIAVLKGNSQMPVLSGGHSIVPGVVAGRARTLYLFDANRQSRPSGGLAMPDNPAAAEVASACRLVAEGDVLISNKTVPQIQEGLRPASGLITEEGGVTCHTAVVARELGKPCVVGVADAVRLLVPLNGATVTLDATACRVFTGDRTDDIQMMSLAHWEASQVSDDVLRRSMHKLAAEMYDVQGAVNRPTNRLGRLQRELYHEGFSRVERRFGVLIDWQHNKGLLKTPAADNALLNAALEAYGLSRWSGQRDAAVSRCQDVVRAFRLDGTSVRDLLDAYADMIAFFHLRWQASRLIERAYLAALLTLPPRGRLAAARLLETRIASDPWRLERHRRHAEIFAAAAAGADVSPLLREYGAQYPPTDNVDWRMPAPTAEQLGEILGPMAANPPPRLQIYQSDEWDGLSTTAREAVDANAHQCVQREKEPFIQAQLHQIIRQRLISAGAQGVRASRFSDSEEIFELTPLELLSLPNDLEGRTGFALAAERVHP